MDDKNHSNHSPLKRLLARIVIFSLLIAVFVVNSISYYQLMDVPFSSFASIALVAVNIMVVFCILLLWWQWVLSSSTEQKRNLFNTQLISELNEKLSYEMQELGIHNEKMSLLIELSDVVQACQNIKEARKAIQVKCRKILHFTEGTLYEMNPETNMLELIAAWGDPLPHKDLFSSDQCWALRKGVEYQVKNPQTDLICTHLDEKSAVPYVCIPLMAQNSVFGLLHLDFFSDHFELTNEHQILIKVVTETLALAMANIQLRETLRSQSLHDSLTGLYNRRYLDEFMVHEMNVAARDRLSFALVMLDIDHFKEFNDTYGHEAGDRVLEEIGRFFQHEIRASDIASRYGGEEFLCVLHDCNLEDAKVRARYLKEKIYRLSVMLKDRRLDHITVSLGIAVYPEDGTTVADLFNAADKALYQAKKSGRNKVVAFSEMNTG